MDKKTILKKLDRIADLPTLPVIAMEVNKMLQDYTTSIEKLSAVIKNDQAMTPRILKLVNSSFYGFKSKIANIDRAIILLGFNTISNAIVAVAIIDALSIKGSSGDFDIKDFWKHSVEVAVISKHLAEKSRLALSEEAFTAGLLHDIGKVILSHYFHSLFKKVILSADENNTTFYEAEKKEIPVTHAQIGAVMAHKWKLPDGLVDTIKYHHAVKTNAKDTNLLTIVHVADFISNHFIHSPDVQLNSALIHPEAVQAMKPQLKTLEDWLPEVREEIASACQFFLEKGR
jgi:putative nucleotidyltransferase with HDIG domain